MHKYVAEVILKQSYQKHQSRCDEKQKTDNQKITLDLCMLYKKLNQDSLINVTDFQNC